MKFKIPKTGFLYVIQRQGNKPFDNSKFDIKIENKTYDVVPSHKQHALDMISDMIINLETMCFDKVQPGNELYYADEIGKQLGISINQLLMGWLPA